MIEGAPWDNYQEKIIIGVVSDLPLCEWRLIVVELQSDDAGSRRISGWVVVVGKAIPRVDCEAL
jgi:hypothetical protein